MATKLAIPNVRLNASDEGETVQTKFNNAMQAVDDNVSAYNAQVDAADTAQSEVAKVLGITQVLNGNVMTKAEFDSIAESNRRLYAGSGFVEWGKHRNTGVGTAYEPINDGMYSTINSTNTLAIGRLNSASGQSNTPSPIININGVLIDVIGNFQGDTVSTGMLFPPAPDGLDKLDGTGRFANLAAAIVAGGTSLSQSVITRKDFALLEGWHEKISDKDVVYPLGESQFGVSTWNSIVLSNTVVAQGYSAFGEWDTVTKGYGVVWSTLSAADKTKFIQDRKNNIYSDNGELIQFRCRIRVIKGLGDSWNFLDFQQNGAALRYSGSQDYIKPKGALSNNLSDLSTFNDTSGYYQNVTNIDGQSQAVDASGNPNVTIAHNGLCFATPITTVQRLNQGAYHPVYNPCGCNLVQGSQPTDSGKFWYFSSADTIVNLSESFSKTSDNPSNTSIVTVSGSIGSTSGRPDGEFYDAIYAGQVQDLRSSARRKSPQELLSYAQKAIAGDIRGNESVPFTMPESFVCSSRGITVGQPYVFSTLADLTQNVGINATARVGYIVGELGIPRQVYVVVHGTTQSNIQLTDATISLADVNLDFIVGNTYILINELPTTSTFEELPWQDIIGLPATILATFPNGIYGQWVSDVNLVVHSVLLNNPSLNANPARSYTIDNGVTWTTDTLPVSTTTNLTSAIGLTGAVHLVSYPAKANFLETANNTKVLAIGDVFATSASDITGFCNNLIGKIAKGGSSQVVDTKAFTAIIEDLRLTGNNLNWGKLSKSYFPSHTPLLLGQPNGAAVKALAYITAENSQYYLQFIYKEMIWSGVAFGDNNKFTAIDGESTELDDNGNTILIGQKRVKLPFFTGEA